MKKIILSFLLLHSGMGYAQMYDANWVMGYPNLILKFDENSFVVDSSDLLNRSNYLLFSNCTVSDTSKVLFYSDGAKIYDKYGDVMKDGDKLFLSQRDLQVTFSDTSVGNNILSNPLILPYKNTEDIFLIIHKSMNDTVTSHDVFYSVVDLKENNGLGKVVTTSQSMARRMSGSNITAIKHANGNRWWIIGRQVNSNNYVKWLFDENGSLFVSDTQAIGPVYSNPDFLVQNVFSERGNVYVTGGQYHTSIFDFDRCTGQLSYRDLIVAPYDSLYNGVTGMQLSKSGQYLYITRYNSLDQYNLWATDVQGSFIRLVDLRIHNIYRKLMYMQTALDGRIYISGYGSPIPFSIINYADSGGFACGLDTFCLPFNNSLNTTGMPTYPHYRTPAAEVYQADAGNSRQVCDSLIAANGVTLGTPHVTGISYQWSCPTNTNFSSTHAQPNVQPTSTTTYILHLQDTVSTYYSCTERWDTVTITVVQSCVSGVQNSEGAWVVRVFPNPATDIVTIETEEPGTFTIYNAVGQLISSAQLNTATSLLPTANWTSGVYYYSFAGSQTKTTNYGKLLKQ